MHHGAIRIDRHYAASKPIPRADKRFTGDGISEVL
jgi:hypothetical protein